MSYHSTRFGRVVSFKGAEVVDGVLRIGYGPLGNPLEITADGGIFEVRLSGGFDPRTEQVQIGVGGTTFQVSLRGYFDKTESELRNYWDVSSYARNIDTQRHENLGYAIAILAQLQKNGGLAMCIPAVPVRL